MFKKLLGSLIFVSALFLGTNHISNVEAARYSEDINDWNSSALDAFDIDKNFFDGYMSMTRSLVTSDMESGYINQLEKDGLLMFAYEDIIGHSYPSNVNNGITIHFTESTSGKESFYSIDDDTAAGFQIVGSGGSTSVDYLFLSFIRDLSNGMLNAAILREGGNLTQPTVKVDGNDIDVYIPYVYYPSDVRKYYATQLSNKLEVLTGKKFDVTIRTSKESTVRKLNDKYGIENFKDTVGSLLLYSYVVSNKFTIDPDSQVQYIENNNPSVYKMGQCYANPNLLFVHNITLAEFLNSGAEQRHNGVSPYTQRYVLADLVYELFFTAKVNRVVFSDYTITLRAGRYLDIESSEYYIGYYFNEGIIK